jgi:hypothetical protein
VAISVEFYRITYSPPSRCYQIVTILKVKIWRKHQPNNAKMTKTILKIKNLEKTRIENRNNFKIRNLEIVKTKKVEKVTTKK